MKDSTIVEELHMNHKVTASACDFLNQSMPKDVQIISINSHLLTMIHNVKSINSKSSMTIVHFNKHTLCYLTFVSVRGNFKGNHVSHTT